MLPIRVLESFHHSNLSDILWTIRSKFDKFDGTFRYLAVLLDEFNLALQFAKEHISLISQFAIDMNLEKVSKVTIRQYEEFREGYNTFMREFEKYCHTINQEIGEHTFKEHFQRLKKWK